MFLPQSQAGFLQQEWVLKLDQTPFFLPIQQKTQKNQSGYATLA